MERHFDEIDFDHPSTCPNCNQFVGHDSVCPNCGAILNDEEDEMEGFDEEDEGDL